MKPNWLIFYIFSTRWGKSKNTKGSYCYIKVGSTIGDVEALGEPITDSDGKVSEDYKSLIKYQ